MEAIKKKMQAMKVEKDLAADNCDVAEETSKAAKERRKLTSMGNGYFRTFCKFIICMEQGPRTWVCVVC